VRELSNKLTKRIKLVANTTLILGTILSLLFAISISLEYRQRNYNSAPESFFLFGFVLIPVLFAVYLSYLLLSSVAEGLNLLEEIKNNTSNSHDAEA
jgi:hypothetical protein